MMRVTNAGNKDCRDSINAFGKYSIIQNNVKHNSQFSCKEENIQHSIIFQNPNAETTPQNSETELSLVELPKIKPTTSAVEKAHRE